MSQVIIENLKNFMQMRSLNSRELAKRAAVKPSFIYDILSGKSSNPSSVKLSQVARALSVTLNDLVEHRRCDIETIEQINTTQAHFPQHRQNTSTPSRSQHITVSGALAESCAPFSHFNLSLLKQHSLSAPDAFELEQVNSDVMSPTLNKGDLVIIDRGQLSPHPAGLFAIKEANGIVVKRLELDPSDTHKVKISCDNPYYSGSESDLDKVTIYGRVIWLSKWV